MGHIAHAMRFSSCITIVILQHSAKSFATLDWTDNLTHACFRIDQTVVETLMIALLVIMRYEFGDRPAERLLTKEDDSVQAFLLNGSHEPFHVRIQIRRFRRQHHRLYASCLEDHAKLLGEYRIPIKDQVTLAGWPQ